MARPMSVAPSLCFPPPSNSAQLWCWVSSEWNIFRIATFYGPIWIVVVTNFIIYIRVGAVVFKWRRQLMSRSAGIGVSSVNYRGSTATPVPMHDVRSPVAAKRYEVSIVSQVPHHSPSRSKQLAMASPTTPDQSRHTRFPSGQTTVNEQPNGLQRRTTIVHPVSQTGGARVVDVNRATISYCYTAFLFFVALLVTWVPSSANRFYTLINPNKPSPYALNFSSGLVLPLQGFWNTIIYIVTSFAACKALLRDIRDAFRFRSHSSVGGSGTSGLPSNVKRHATQLGSADTTDRTSDAPTKSTHLHDGKHSHTLSETKSPRKSGSADKARSRDQRADIVISFDGKKRVVHHDYRSSMPENQYNPFEKHDWYVPSPVIPPRREEEEKDKLDETRLHVGAEHNMRPMNHDRNYEDIDLADNDERIGVRIGNAHESNIGFAK